MITFISILVLLIVLGAVIHEYFVAHHGEVVTFKTKFIIHFD
jgi:hypothetical protein